MDSTEPTTGPYGQSPDYSASVLIPNITNLLGGLAYGIYLVLYILSMYILYKKRTSGSRIQSIILTLLWGLITAGLVLKYYYMILQAQNAQGFDDLTFEIQFDIYRAFTFTTLVTNTFTEFLLIWRCYMIWGRRKAVVVAPLLLAFAAMASVAYPGTLTWGSVSLVNNLLISGLIAGRILYISRQVSRSLGNSSRFLQMYRAILLASIESAIILPIVFIIMLVITNVPGIFDNMILLQVGNGIFYLLQPILGIAVTLVIVRVALGIAINDEGSFGAAVLPERTREQTRSVVMDIFSNREEAWV